VFPEPVFGFDSFNGLPEDWNADHRRGKFAQAVPSVQPNVELIVGLFAKTLPQFLKERSDQQVSLLHIDCDLYSSTKVIFEELSSRIVPGTVIIFDEYFNYPGWQQHEFKAFQEFVFSRSLKYSYIGFNRSHAQVTVVIDG
jgi:predicted O-methyltransferase YrrM